MAVVEEGRTRTRRAKIKRKGFLKPIVRIDERKNIWIFDSNRAITDQNGVPYSKHMQVRKSTIKGAGKGVFSKVDIPPYIVIGVYRGAFLNESEALALPSQTYLLRIRPGRYYVDAEDKSVGNWTRYINDPYGPKRTRVRKKKLAHRKNVAFTPDGFIFTCAPIQKGQELFIDYGDAYWMYD